MIDYEPSRPLIVGISGASGAVYGIRLIKVLQKLGLTTAAVVSRSAEKVLALEHGLDMDRAVERADYVYDPEDIAAPIASGSYQTRGMVVSPCSMKTLSAIVNSYADNLLTRAADVCLKEKRPLILVVRETPLHRGHLELMLKATKLGAIILPPMPAFYHHPETLDDIIDQTIGKILDLLEIEHNLFRRWGESEQLMV